LSFESARHRGEAPEFISGEFHLQPPHIPLRPVLLATVDEHGAAYVRPAPHEGMRETRRRLLLMPTLFVGHGTHYLLFFEKERIVKTLSLVLFLSLFLPAHALAEDPFGNKKLNIPPRGFTALFNGKDLDGWWGLATTPYEKYRDLALEEFEELKKTSREDIAKHWRVENGELINDGHGLYLTTNEFYADFELLLQYKTVPKADSGVYLRGIPQVQIWDTTEEGGKWGIGADKGSGGLWNNAQGSPGKDPLVHADKPFGQWNDLRVVMVGQEVSVWLNGKLVVDDAVLANFFNRDNPIPDDGPIQLQTHGGEIRWRNIFIREIGPDISLPGSALAKKSVNRWTSRCRRRAVRLFGSGPCRFR